MLKVVPVTLGFNVKKGPTLKFISDHFCGRSESAGPTAKMLRGDLEGLETAEL